VIGIGAIGCYVPELRIANRERMQEFEVTEEFLAGKLGFQAVARKAESEQTSDLCVKAVAALKAEPAVAAAPHGLGAIQCLFLCTQNPDGRGLPHTSAIVHEKLGLPAACACLDISLGCSGFVHSLVVARAFMEANGMTSGLLLTADPYSKILDHHDRNTAMIFGDGAAATWLTEIRDGALLAPTRARFHTEGHRHKALQNRDGVLHMDGRAVFNFSATAVPVEINGLLAEAGLGKDAIDLYLLHQGSRYIVDTIRTRLKLDEARVPLALADCGNTVSSSIPMMLQGLVRDAGAKRIVLSGFGVGLAVATCLLERKTSNGKKQ